MLIIHFSIYPLPDSFLKSKIIDLTNYLPLYWDFTLPSLTLHLQKWNLTFLLQKKSSPINPKIYICVCVCAFKLYIHSSCALDEKLGIVLEIIQIIHTQNCIHFTRLTCPYFIIFITFHLTQSHHLVPKSQKLLLITFLLLLKFSL